MSHGPELRADARVAPGHDLPVDAGSPSGSDFQAQEGMPSGLDLQAHAGVSLWHIALSVADLRLTQRWYSDTLGLMYARGTSLMAGPLISWTLGLRGAATSCWWLNDRQDLFQLEMFEFRSPLTRALPADWRPSAIGYTAISVHTKDLDAALERAERNGSPPLTPPRGDAGARRACVRDPDGVLVELMEEDPRGTPQRARPRSNVPAVVRSVTLSVADLERSRRLFVEGLGLREAAGIELHRPEHEVLWGLAGAARDTALLWAGDFLVELVSYRRPPAAAREPGWRISDRGLFHICFGFSDKTEFQRVLARARALGARGNSPVVSIGASASLFIVDEEGFTIELLYRHPRLRQAADAEPKATPRRLPLRIKAPAGTRRKRCFREALVLGADTAIGAELCRLMAEDGSSLLLLDAPDALAEQIFRLTGASARAIDLAALRALLEASQGIGGQPASQSIDGQPDLILALPEPSSPSRRSPHGSPHQLALLLPLAPGVRHVTAILHPAARRELAVLRAQLTRMACTSTLATLSQGPPRLLDGTPLRAALLLTAREAAEAIYLATLRRRSSLRSPPSVWPPRRGASEAPTPEGFQIRAPSREALRDAIERLPEPVA
jgi:catechol 2,3-dioxygenase-like lactoylglutathione lyase family enzyme